MDYLHHIRSLPTAERRQIYRTAFLTDLPALIAQTPKLAPAFAQEAARQRRGR